LTVTIILGEENKLWSSSHAALCNLLSTLFSNTLSLCASFHVWGQVSHTYRTTGNITVLHILIFIFLGSRQENKIFWIQCYQTILMNIKKRIPLNTILIVA
jgi:hypothetical protein